MSLPTIYKRASDGSIQQWTIEAYGEPTNEASRGMYGVIETVYGKVGGSMMLAKDLITEGKNQGRANETTAVEQAVAEAQSKWETKLKKGYCRTIEEAREGKTDAIIAGGVDPMLAQSYEKHAAKIRYPAFAQPKLDGHRCIAIVKDGKATLWSRTRKRITGVPHIERVLEALIPGDTVLDGELYNHDYADRFNELTSFIRSAKPKPGHEVVQYWVYDVVNEESQAERFWLLKTMEAAPGYSPTGPILFLPTAEVEDDEAMVALFGEWLSMGFEGLMLRNRAATYKVGGRSYDLQKVKIMQDSEFELVAIEEGRGKMMGKAVFVCATETGETFKCKMVGALDSLAVYLQNPEDYIGRMVTVQYQNLHPETGIPRFGVALRFREDV